MQKLQTVAADLQPFLELIRERNFIIDTATNSLKILSQIFFQRFIVEGHMSIGSYKKNDVKHYLLTLSPRKQNLETSRKNNNDFVVAPVSDEVVF